MIRKDLKHIQLENQQEQDHTGISDAGVNTTGSLLLKVLNSNKHILAKISKSKTSRFWSRHQNLRGPCNNVRSTTMDMRQYAGFYSRRK
jgi:hypothetical protein